MNIFIEDFMVYIALFLGGFCVVFGRGLMASLTKEKRGDAAFSLESVVGRHSEAVSRKLLITGTCLVVGVGMVIGFGSMIGSLKNLHFFGPLFALAWGAFCGIATPLFVWKLCKQYLGRIVSGHQSSFGVGSAAAFKISASAVLFLIGLLILESLSVLIFFGSALDLNILGMADAVFSVHSVSYQGQELSSWHSGLVGTESYESLKSKWMFLIGLCFAIGVIFPTIAVRLGASFFGLMTSISHDLLGRAEKKLTNKKQNNPLLVGKLTGFSLKNMLGQILSSQYLMMFSLFVTVSVGGLLANHHLTLWTPIELVRLPFFFLAIGSAVSLIIMSLLRLRPLQTQEKLKKRLSLGVASAGFVLMAILSALAMVTNLDWPLISSVLVGILLAVLLEQWATYFMFLDKKTTALAQTKLGLLKSVGFGLVSMVMPLVLISVGVIAGYFLFGGIGSFVRGLYGVSLVALGMVMVSPALMVSATAGTVNDYAEELVSCDQMSARIMKGLTGMRRIGHVSKGAYRLVEIVVLGLLALPILIVMLRGLLVFLTFLGRSNIIGIDGIGFSAASQQAAIRGIHFIDHVSVLSLFEIFNVNMLNPYVLAGMTAASLVVFLSAGLAIIALSSGVRKLKEGAISQIQQDILLLNGESTPDADSLINKGTSRSAISACLIICILCMAPAIVMHTMQVAGVVGYMLGILLSSALLFLMFFMVGSILKADYFRKLVESPKEATGHISFWFGDPLKDIGVTVCTVSIVVSSLVILLLWPVRLLLG